MSRLLLFLAAIVAVLPLHAQENWENFEEGGKYGFMDESGNVVIRPQFDNAWNFHEGLAMVGQNGKRGFIDKTGIFIIRPRLELAWSFSDGLALVRQKGRYGFIDKTGKYVIQPQYDDAGSFRDGIAPVQLNGTYAYIDKTGKSYSTFEEAKAQLAQKRRQAERSWKAYLSYHLGSKADFLKAKGLVTPSEEEIKAAVQRELKAWAAKGEFELTAKWQARVTDASIRAMAQKLAKQYVEGYNKSLAAASAEYNEKLQALADDYTPIQLEKFSKQALDLKPYDADNQTFLISAGEFGNILLPVPMNEAPAFKSDWLKLKSSADPEFALAGNDLVLKSIKFGRYTYATNIRANYAQTDTEYALRPIDISDLGIIAPASTEFKVKSFEMALNDLTARMGSTARVDNNGTKCAVLKVYVADQISAVHGNVIGSVTAHGMEKWVYLTNGTKEIELLFDNHLPLHIRFANHNPDHSSLASECVYKLYLTESR